MEMEDERPWLATVDYGAEGLTRAVLRRRNRGGVEMRQGCGPDTEHAIAAALGLPSASFATRQDDEGAAIAAFRMRPFRLSHTGPLMHFGGLL